MNKNNKLMRSMAWAQREFAEGSIPNPRTLRKWVESGIIRGRIIGNTVWIFASERMGVHSDVSTHVHHLINEWK